MKKLFVLMLCASFNIHAESRVLPPVVDNSTYVSGSNYTQNAPTASAMYEVLGRMEQLQLELQQLRGVVEEQSQTIDDLRKRQGNIYSDLDQRIQVLTGGGIGVLTSQNTGSTDKPFAIKPNQLETKPESVEKVTPSSQLTQDNNMQAEKIAESVPVKNQKQRYTAAYETLRNGHNNRAITEFKLFISEFPNGEYADNAQYWLGEAYKVNQDLNAAKMAFTTVITRYADSPKVPDALLKLGYIELEQKNMAKARDYLTQVTVGHPKSTAAHLATKKLRQMEIMQP